MTIYIEYQILHVTNVRALVSYNNQLTRWPMAGKLEPGDEDEYMKTHNHVWRDTVMPRAKKTKEELIDTVKQAGQAGYWLKEGDRAFAKELWIEGRVTFCCGNNAITATDKI